MQYSIVTNGHHVVYSVQFTSVAQSCLTLCDPMNCSAPGLPVHHHLPEFTQTHVHRVSDAIQPSHPRSSPSPPAPNPSQHESLLMSQLFSWGGQSTGASASASFLHVVYYSPQISLFNWKFVPFDHFHLISLLPTLCMWQPQIWSLFLWVWNF